MPPRGVFRACRERLLSAVPPSSLGARLLAGPGPRVWSGARGVGGGQAGARDAGLAGGGGGGPARRG